MTTVRIAHAEPRPGKLSNGDFQTRGYLVVLADDAAHRAVPVWLSGEPGEEDLARLVELAAQPTGEVIASDAPEELTARLLHVAGVGVTEVDIQVTDADADELRPQAAVTHVGLSGPAGIRRVTTGLGLGLAMAAAAGAPLRLADEVVNRLAVPVPGDDLLGPVLDRVPPMAGAPLLWPLATVPGKRLRFEPRNLDFAAGLDRWDLDAGSRRAVDPSRPPDYSAAVDGESAVLSSAVPRPAGSAVLVQAVFADDYRGGWVAFRGEIRTKHATEQAGLRLEILRHWWRTGRAREDHGVTVAGGHPTWTGHEITALIPADADIIRFGVMLTGTGSIALRHPELRAVAPAHRA